MVGDATRVAANHLGSARLPSWGKMINQCGRGTMRPETPRADGPERSALVPFVASPGRRPRCRRSPVIGHYPGATVQENRPTGPVRRDT